MDQEQQAEFYSSVADGLLLARVGEVDDAAEAVLHCVNQTFTTGTVIGVGGAHCWSVVSPTCPAGTRERPVSAV